MEYKRVYEPDEVHGLYDWFKDVDYDGPLDMGHGRLVKNTKHTVKCLILQTENNIGNPNFSGLINQLSIIKDELIRQKLVDKQ